MSTEKEDSVSDNSQNSPSINNEDLVKENLQIHQKFLDFYENNFEGRNNYIMLYKKILENKNYLSELNFDPQKRINEIVNFSLRKRRIEKDYLNNPFVSHINKVIGYVQSKEDRKIYLVESKGKIAGKMFGEHIFIPQNLAKHKMKKENLNEKCLDKEENLESYKFA